MTISLFAVAAACSGGGAQQAVSPGCDQAVAKVAGLPGLNATIEQTPDIVLAAQADTLVACRSAAEWKAAVKKHPDVINRKTSVGDGLKAFCHAATSPPARTSPTCQSGS